MLDVLIEKSKVIYEAEANEEVVVATSTPVLLEVEWTRERIEQAIRETFPEDSQTAVAIAKAESGLKATAYNPEKHRGCSGSIGLMQVACVHHTRDPKALENPLVNLQKARQIYDDSKARTGNGWLPWGAYSNGSYKKFI